jgi:hypothetical protein
MVVPGAQVESGQVLVVLEGTAGPEKVTPEERASQEQTEHQ